MVPAALLCRLRIDVAQSSPDAQVSVSNHQPRAAQAPALDVPEHLGPVLCGLPVSGNSAHHHLAPVAQGRHHHQYRRLLLLKRRWEGESVEERTRIIALTAHALKADTQRSLDAGCTAHVPSWISLWTWLRTQSSKSIKKVVLMETIYEHTRSAMA